MRKNSPPTARRSSTLSVDDARVVPVGAARLDEAWRVLRHLRPGLERRRLAEALRRGGRAHRLGYRLRGLEVRGRLVALAGGRPLVTLARGPHLHIDDFVVVPAWRGRGAGRRLLEALEEDARHRGLVAVHLDSFLDALGFYEALGFTALPCRTVRKKLLPPPRTPRRGS